MGQIAWVDVKLNTYTMSEITDSHLINIIRFIIRGGGHEFFLTEEIIFNLLNEFSRRGLRL